MTGRVIRKKIMSQQAGIWDVIFPMVTQKQADEGGKHL